MDEEQEVVYVLTSHKLPITVFRDRDEAYSRLNKIIERGGKGWFVKTCAII
jgi:hypothetical protein